MKDFAKSIVCNVKAEVASIESAAVGNYDPNDYKDDPRHKWTVKSIENEIQKYKQRIELNRVRMTQLRNMENSGNYPSSSRELKEEQKDYEANQMKIKQLVSMLRRATGNSMEEVGNANVGNAEIFKDGDVWVVLYAEGTKSKEFKTEADAKKFAAQVENSKTGNSKVGNAYQYAGSIPIEKIPDNWRPEFPKAGYVVYYAPNKAKWFATEAEAKRFAESQDKAQKTGNTKVGNANTHLTASNSGELWLNYDGTGEMYDPIELGRYDFSGKSEAMSVVRDLEQLKRKAEQKVKDADKFINAIKQWASGLK